jgi:hypothetical protein
MSNSISALPFHFILFPIHGIATSEHCNSSLPPSAPLSVTHDAMDFFSTSGVNCVSYATKIMFDITHDCVTDLGKREVGMIELLFIIILSE